jgi:putative inorganic carbon (hco3(-)) transporter
LDRCKTAAALAFAGLAGHAFFLPVSIAGMQLALGVATAGILLAPPRPLRTPLDLPALAFIAVAILSDAVSPYGTPGLAAATLWRSVLGFLIVGHALRIAPARTPQHLVVCLALGLLGASVVGLLQYRTGVDLVHELGLRAHPALVEAPGVQGRFGAMGFFTSRLTFGHNATLVLATLAGALVTGALPRCARPVVVAISLMGVSAVAITFDRAAYLAIAVAGVVLAVRSGNRRAPVVVAAVAALATLHPGVRARLATAFSASANADRLFIWSRALEIIRDHPVLGVGFANFPLVCGPYYDRVDPGFSMRTWAHNLELSTLAEMGPLGLVALLWLLIAGVRLVLRSTSPFAAGALAALAAWFTIAQAHDVIYDTKVMYALWFSLALGTSPEPKSATTG